MDKHYRHGDILLIKIDKLPDSIKFKTKKNKVILKGEVTGHAHRLKGNAKILEEAERIINPSPTASLPVRNIPMKRQIIGYAVVKEPTELNKPNKKDEMLAKIKEFSKKKIERAETTLKGKRP